MSNIVKVCGITVMKVDVDNPITKFKDLCWYNRNGLQTLKQAYEIGLCTEREYLVLRKKIIFG